MIKTNLDFFYCSIKTYLINIFDKQLSNLSLNLLNTLLGFFIATCLTTIPGQTGDWSITGAAIIVSFHEIISMIHYNNKSHIFNIFFKHFNNLKIGILYGFFVDAFKLGS
uniref:Uncharacterized protein ycf20 n=1 Tax=Kumanoa americana TaxID=1196377 RepID=A0A1C9CGL6_9FLOR|nr:hypothetical protein Kuma_073 [Kumanoa americana]AOM67507.1 hypothetical protein Kuma_073 [Kumanoa americana]